MKQYQKVLDEDGKVDEYVTVTETKELARRSVADCDNDIKLLRLEIVELEAEKVEIAAARAGS